MTDGMMNDTDPEVSLLESLEFDPVCEVQVQRKLRFFLIPLEGWKNCSAPAAWIGSFPCCGSTVMSCDPHRSNGVIHFWQCCGHDFKTAYLTWTRI